LEATGKNISGKPWGGKEKAKWGKYTQNGIDAIYF